MRVFVTGATGFVGTAVVRELLGAGHAVLGLARSEASVKSLVSMGAQVHQGSLTDTDSLARGAAEADGVIHTAFIHDFLDGPPGPGKMDIAGSGRVDLLAIEAMGEALAGSGRPLVVTSATSHLAPGRPATEDDGPDPKARARHRVASEQAALALSARGVRSMLLRLPHSVHGDGDHAFVPALIAVARAKGVSGYVGEGKNRWAAVHRLDAARLYRLALEKGAAGARYHAAGDEGVPTRALAEAIGRRLSVPVVSVAPEAAAEHFGWLAMFLSHDGPASSARTQEQLGWQLREPGLLADLERGSYFG